VEIKMDSTFVVACAAIVIHVINYNATAQIEYYTKGISKVCCGFVNT
jgi:hypothetical protein